MGSSREGNWVWIIEWRCQLFNWENNELDDLKILLNGLIPKDNVLDHTIKVLKLLALSSLF